MIVPHEEHIAERDLAGIWQGLENTNWLTRIDEEPLIAERSEKGVWSVEAWKPDIEEK